MDSNAHNSKMSDLCLAFTDFPEEYIHRQIRRFAEDYLFGLTSGLWNGEDESDELYEMIIKVNEINEDSMEQVELTKQLIDMFKGEVSRSVISVEDILIHLQITADDFCELFKILAADDFVSMYDRNPMEKSEENDEETYFIGLN